MKEVAIVYMLAGLSKRFGGKPKGLAKIGPNNETLMECSLKQSVPAGFKKIIFVVSEKTKESFMQAFGQSYKGVSIYYAVQDFDSKTRDKPWGTLDALCAAKKFIDCPFVVCNGDDLYGEEPFKIIVNHLKNENNGTTAAYKLKEVLSEKGVVNRAIFETDKENFVTSITEVIGLSNANLQEKSFSQESPCSMNIFGFQKETIIHFQEALEEFKRLHKGDRTAECYLPEETGNLIKSKKLKLMLYPTNSQWIGLTNPEDEEKAKIKLAKA